MPGRVWGEGAHTLCVCVWQYPSFPVSWGGHNTVPPLGWLKNSRNFFSQNSEGYKSICQQVQALLTPWVASSPPTTTPSLCWWLTLLGLPWECALLQCLPVVTWLSPFSMSKSLSSYKDHQSHWIRGTPIHTLQDDLILTNYILGDPIAK